MNEKLSTKVLETEDVSKLISNFNLGDYSNIDSGQIKVVIALLRKEQTRLTEEIANLSRDSGLDAAIAKLKSVKDIVDILLNILSQRVEDGSLGDKSLVVLTKDSVTEVVTNGESTVETTEVIDDELLIYHEVKYHFSSHTDYNEATESNKTEEEFYYDLICKFISLSLDCCFKIGKKRLSELDAAVVSEIVEKNYQWHTLIDSISADTVKLNSVLTPEKITELLNCHFITTEIKSKDKKPTHVQMSLFDTEEEFEQYNVLPEGDAIDEQ